MALMETKVFDLAGAAIDLLADPDVAAAVSAGPVDGVRLLVQAVDVDDGGRVFYRESADAPALTELGHPLAENDALVLLLSATAPDGAWVWSPGTGKLVASASD